VYNQVEYSPNMIYNISMRKRRVYLKRDQKINIVKKYKELPEAMNVTTKVTELALMVGATRRTIYNILAQYN